MKAGECCNQVVCCWDHGVGVGFSLWVILWHILVEWLLVSRIIELFWPSHESKISGRVTGNKIVGINLNKHHLSRILFKAKNDFMLLLLNCLILEQV